MPDRNHENEGFFERIDRRAQERDAKWVPIHAEDNYSEFNPLGDWRSKIDRQNLSGTGAAGMLDRGVRAEAAAHVKKIMAEGTGAKSAACRPTPRPCHSPEPQRTDARLSSGDSALRYEGATPTMILLRDSEGFRLGVRIASIEVWRERTLGVQMVLHSGETILVIGASYDTLSDVIDGWM
ncbi:hypothetical protein [Azospirillum sp. TSO5]|uniref:hypothetical protein n=1 Tax=Azospirillum sp. TSO5 TaxID=716760 RepID=UPI000D60BFEA|nr:hypothetical protein [Azospirillum sp. TSO5]PWC92931.1 hypothetical protein TSO5_16005 [Azospirillum sp. TSO5]